MVCGDSCRQSKLLRRRYGYSRPISPRSLLMAATPLPLPNADSTTEGPTVNFSQARFAFRQLETWLTSDETASVTEAQVEEQLAERGREVLRLLLQAHLRQRGTGDVGPALLV